MKHTLKYIIQILCEISDKCKKTDAFIQNLREFHTHEETTHEEREKNADERNRQQKYSVQSWHRRLVGLVQHYKPQPSHCEEEARCQTFHYILAVDTVLHKSNLKQKT